MNQFAPPQLAIEGDRIGLQVGDPNAEVKGVLVTLEVTDAVIEEAIAKGANWILSHHALLFHPLKELRIDQAVGRMAVKLVKNEIQLFVAHTNLDAAKDGVNDVLAKRLQLEEQELFVQYKEEKLKKIVVFVPESHHANVLEAMAEAGAGWIGNYSHCTFNLKGTGTFLPREGTNPFIGEQGKLEKVEEIRLETIVPESIQNKVIQAMLSAHPYEEVAYDVYPLDNAGAPIGFGKVGVLPEAITLGEFAKRVKEALNVPHLRVVGDQGMMVRKVALLGGSGSRYLKQAKQRGADVYLTGDIDYHTAQEAKALGIGVIDPGHHVEQLVVPAWCEKLQEAFAGKFPVFASEIDMNPFTFF
jgi:dinuclear metal center YbgI/SA1388 family protein